MPVRTPVYLDNHASTAPDPAVLEVMHRVARDHYGNPSASHAQGWAAAQIIEEARGHVAALVGAEPREVVFTGGATEADNLAVLGTAAAWPAPGHIVASPLEHAAVSGPLARLEELGWSVTRVPVGADGIVDPAAVESALRADTRLVCCIAAQNEIGTIQPVAELGRLCRSRGVPLFCDGAQAAGRVPVAFAADGLGLLTLSAHKLYGPKGIGALCIRRRDPRPAVVPLAFGGGQERALRPGTPAVAAIAGFGVACRLAGERLESDAARLRGLAERFLGRLRAGVDGVIVNGDPERRLPGSLNLSFAGVPPGRLVPALPQLAVSTGSACASGGGEPSRILEAIGVPPALAAASLRLCFGRTSVDDEADFAADSIIAAVTRLRGGAALR